jgi:hypothetical protein
MVTAGLHRSGGSDMPLRSEEGRNFEMHRYHYPSVSSSGTAIPSNPKCFDIEADMANALIPQNPNSRPKYFRNLYEECIFVFAIMMATSSTTFLQGATVINTANIGKDLNMNPANISWISAALG